MSKSRDSKADTASIHVTRLEDGSTICNILFGSRIRNCHTVSVEHQSPKCDVIPVHSKITLDP
jgi:hypothetical protein